MNIEEFREYCLSLPDATEATPFEKFSRRRYTILVFYVGGHMFCYFRSTSGRLLPTGRKNVDDFSNITIKCSPAEIAFRTFNTPNDRNSKNYHYLCPHINVIRANNYGNSNFNPKPGTDDYHAGR